jgi:UDPglucose 6-dehydrogenase
MGKRICVIGTGYVGLVTGACFAEMGHDVACVDIDEAKVAALQQGRVPIYEPGLAPLVQSNVQRGRLHFTTSFEEGVAGADFTFMCVGTPANDKNQADLSFLRAAYLSVGDYLKGQGPILVNKSTIPPGTTDWVAAVLSQVLNGRGVPPIVANPEFLREGHAVSDFMRPNRVVIGAENQTAAEAVADLYRPLGAPIMFTDARTAEMVKYASNAFLAMKVSFINEIAAVCERIGVDVTGVAKGIGLDPRIGPDYLRAGIGYGGSCLPKDTAALAHLGANLGQELKLLNAVIKVNAKQPARLVHRVKQALGALRGARVAVLGLTFKSDTDDLRASPAVEVVRTLQAEGAEVSCYDPQAVRAQDLFQAPLTFSKDAYDAAQDADAIVIATEWAEFKSLDLDRLAGVMRGRVLADGRNIIDPERAQEAGFLYLGVGHGEATKLGREPRLDLALSPS